ANVNSGLTLTGRGDPAQIPSRTVSGNFFDVLGVSMALGRALRPDDDREGSPAVVVLSDALWRQRFGADPSIVGAPLRPDARAFPAAGRAPRCFAYPAGVELWATIAHAEPDQVGNRNVGWLELVGLVKPGAAIDAVRTDLGAITDRLARTYHPSRGRETLSI